MEDLVQMLLSSQAERELEQANPFLQDRDTVFHCVVAYMCLVVRIGHTLRTIVQVQELLALLRVARDDREDRGVGGREWSSFAPSVVLKARAVTTLLTTRRSFIEEGAFDPRFLFFEFAYNLVLRSSQVTMITKLAASALEGHSLCHQMIMGAGVLSLTVLSCFMHTMPIRSECCGHKVFPL